MGVAVILSRLVVLVIRIDRRQFFEPLINVRNQPILVIVKLNARGDLHGGYQHPAFHFALTHNCFNLGCEMNVSPVGTRVKFQIFGVGLHWSPLKEL
jgi:hypothetical protein